MGIFKALIIALSLALDVFAVSIGVGMNTQTRAEAVRIGTAFVIAELLMVSLGAAFGSVILRTFGPIAAYAGFFALIAIGIYMIKEAFDEGEHKFDLSKGTGLILGSLAVSLDSLGIGFSILFIDVPFQLTLLFIAIASVTATSSGFLLGRKLGVAVGERVGIYAGVILILTGIVFGLLKATGHG